MNRNFRLCLVAVLPAISFWSVAGFAQELAPRAYWPAPTGTNVLVLGYQYSAGDIVTDPSLPIAGVDLFGRTTNMQFNLPYTSGLTKGFVGGEFRSRHISAMADARVRLSVNLRGAPAMDADGFRALRAKPQTIIGASVLVQLPTGGYDPDRLINAGANRWAVKPAVGVIWPVRPTWLLEFELGANSTW